jgi:hypothetical protein
MIKPERGIYIREINAGTLWEHKKYRLCAILVQL